MLWVFHSLIRKAKCFPGKPYTLYYEDKMSPQRWQHQKPLGTFFGPHEEASL